MTGLFKKTLCIEIEGGSAERFLNIASRRWLNIFNVSSRQGRTLAFCPAKEFPALCAVAEKTGCQLKVISRYGIAYYAEKYRDRCIRIPMVSEARSLNLSNSVAIIAYEALRQQGFEGLKSLGSMADKQV